MTSGTALAGYDRAVAMRVPDVVGLVFLSGGIGLASLHLQEYVTTVVRNLLVAPTAIVGALSAGAGFLVLMAGFAVLSRAWRKARNRWGSGPINQTETLPAAP